MTVCLSMAHGTSWALETPQPVGILNATPNSFSDGGALYHPSFGLNIELLNKRLKQWETDCKIVDVGGESTRPGAPTIPLDEECQRILPAIEYIRSHFPHLCISVDTRKAAVAEQAIQAGAHLINDVSGGQYDARMFEVVANTGAGYVLMHSQGTPKTMQVHPVYQNVMAEVRQFFETQLAALASYGVSRHHILLDPGFGFGKTVEHNLTLLQNLAGFNRFGCPLLVGLSRKSFLTLGNTDILPPAQRDELTAIAHTLAYQQGAAFFRTHNPFQTARQLRLLERLIPPNSPDRLNTIKATH